MRKFNYQLSEFMGMKELGKFLNEWKEASLKYGEVKRLGKDFVMKEGSDKSQGDTFAIFTQGLKCEPEREDQKEVKKDNFSKIQEAKRERQHKIVKGE